MGYLNACIHFKGLRIDSQVAALFFFFRTVIFPPGPKFEAGFGLRSELVM